MDRYLNHEGVPELAGGRSDGRGPSVRRQQLLETNRFGAITLFRRNPHCFAVCRLSFLTSGGTSHGSAISEHALG